MMIIGLWILIWLLTVLLSSCTLGPTEAPGSAPVQADRSTVVSRRPATFTESYRWVDGLAVEVVEVSHGRLRASIPVDAPTAQVGDSCSELTIVVRNGSDQMVRIALTARLRYGPDMTSAPTYVATAAHADHATMQFVDPGEVSSPYTLGDGSIEVARSQEVSEAIIGLTVVAIGTTAPELVTTLVSTIRGDRDIAIGNLLGSSVYNIAVILGITILMAPSALMIPPEVVAADLLFLAVATVITVPVLLSGQRMTRVEGGAFVVGYVGYLLWLVLA
jgi:hypothetical protein